MSTITLKEFALHRWDHAGVTVYKKPGDLHSLSGLYPTADRRQLQRCPAWAAADQDASLTNIAGAFFDYANSRYVLIGTDSGNDLACTYFSSAWVCKGTSYALHGAPTGLGGLSGRNVLYHHGYLYVIGSDGKVYRGTDYTTTLSAYYTSTDAYILGALGTRIYMISTTGTVYRSNANHSAFEAYLNPIVNYTPLWATAYRGSLCLFARQDDGSLRVFTMPDAPLENITQDDLDETAVLPNDSGSYPSGGCLFCQHDDKIYFCPGRTLRPDGYYHLDIYAYNGSYFERAATIADSKHSLNSAGLLRWRGELLYYSPTSTGPGLQILLGDYFTPFAPSTTWLITDATPPPLLFSLNGELIVVGQDSIDGEKTDHAGAAAFTNGNLYTSWLDMDRPGTKKRLHRITVHTTNAVTTSTVTVYYRADDESSWTTAVTQAGAVVRSVADNLAKDFYRMQIKVTLTDTNTAQDLRLDSISVHYSLGDA